MSQGVLSRATRAWLLPACICIDVIRMARMGGLLSFLPALLKAGDDISNEAALNNNQHGTLYSHA